MQKLSFLYESERNTRILSSQVFDYTLRSFLDFSLLAGGVARRDVIIYKVDRVCIIMNGVTISIRVLSQMFKNRFSAY